LLVQGGHDYPAALQNVHGAPVALYAEGRVELLDAPAFAIVGSRNATALGSQDAQAMAHALSDAGLTIVSGLALGIDAAAHRGGLAGAASSIAVMGTGADIHYPRRNAALADQVAAEGCIVTEFPLGTPSSPGNFPRRNRLISGLSRGVLVVEAALGSGSLITAKYALDQNRDVFAVPGSIHATLSKGCHWLIKEGAKLVESADDILLDLGMQGIQSPSGRALEAPPSRDPLLDVMGYAPMSFDEFAMHTGLGAATLAAQLAKLELEGRIEVLPGARFQRARRREIE
jgi:DNA processing protein